MCLVLSTCTYVSCYCVNVASERIVFRLQINHVCEGARYMRLISWTLRSGSEQFIYNWNGNNVDLDQGAGSSKKERTRQATERQKD
jgi:hypothetical protein